MITKYLRVKKRFGAAQADYLNPDSVVAIERKRKAQPFPSEVDGPSGSTFKVQRSKLGIAAVPFIRDRNTLNIEL
jgi:hypothetical protein